VLRYYTFYGYDDGGALMFTACDAHALRDVIAWAENRRRGSRFMTITFMSAAEAAKQGFADFCEICERSC